MTSPHATSGGNEAKESGPQPERYVALSAIRAVCSRIMKESESLAADSPDYRIGQWSGAEKVQFELGCIAETSRSETAPLVAGDLKTQREIHDSYAPSAIGDSGTEKLLRDLLDRGYKMHVFAGTTTYLSAQDGDQNDPLLAWLSDVRAVLYGKTKPVPEVRHV